LIWWPILKRGIKDRCNTKWNQISKNDDQNASNFGGKRDSLNLSKDLKKSSAYYSRPSAISTPHPNSHRQITCRVGGSLVVG
jgi:hypothetical protein